MSSPKSVLNCSVGPAFDGACGTRPFVTFSYRMYRIVRGCGTPLGWAHLFRRSEVSDCRGVEINDAKAAPERRAHKSIWLLQRKPQQRVFFLRRGWFVGRTCG